MFPLQCGPRTAVSVRSCRYGVDARLRQELVEAGNLDLQGQCFLHLPTAATDGAATSVGISNRALFGAFGHLTSSARPSPPDEPTRHPAPRFAPHTGSTERLRTAYPGMPESSRYDSNSQTWYAD